MLRRIKGAAGADEKVCRGKEELSTLRVNE
jgi:hypothetical protein